MTNELIQPLTDKEIRTNWVAFIHNLQDKICAGLEAEDGKATFKEELWQREGGGGGRTRVIADGNVLEKGGVNISEVYGDVTDVMRKALPDMKGDKWFACGLSMVLHPSNPFVPTTHCNYRMFELYDKAGNVIDRWFGGGTDLTPFYLDVDDAKHFHKTYKDICDKYDTALYPEYKKWCDEYFTNHHRGEMRGIGGIFYDHQRVTDTRGIDFWFNLAKDCGEGFLDAYLPIVSKNKNKAFTPENKFWQEIRRGRYVEFNLVWDRGTIFGLKTNGRTESILMSLPPTVRFEYEYAPKPGTPEDDLLQACIHPRAWA